MGGRPSGAIALGQGGSMGRATVEARVLEFAEALAVVLRHAAKVRVPEAERVGLLEAAGRELAEDVAADRDQPPFDRATRVRGGLDGRCAAEGCRAGSRGRGVARR